MRLGFRRVLIFHNPPPRHTSIVATTSTRSGEPALPPIHPLKTHRLPQSPHGGQQPAKVIPNSSVDEGARKCLDCMAKGWVHSLNSTTPKSWKSPYKHNSQHETSCRPQANLVRLSVVIIHYGSRGAKKEEEKGAPWFSVYATLQDG